MIRKLVVPCLIAAAVVASNQPAGADPGRGSAVQCYLWAHDPAPAIGVPYVPSTTYAYNAVGRAQANTVTRTATGVYTVTCKGVGGGALFKQPDTADDALSTSVSTESVARAGGEPVEPELVSGSWGAGGHVQVTAYGSTSDFCKVQGWGTGGPDFTATVRCFKVTGAAVDSRFDLLFVW